MTTNLKAQFDQVVASAKALPDYPKWSYQDRRHFLRSNLKVRGLTSDVLATGGEDFLHYCDVEFESFALGYKLGSK